MIPRGGQLPKDGGRDSVMFNEKRKEKGTKFKLVTINGEKLVEMSHDGIILTIAKRIVLGNKVYKAPSNNG